jgi:acyl-CoA hydrolase/RimJ/RimL family protein N-acetyltransferase
MEQSWEKMVKTPEEIFEKINPGMTIFLGTGVAEPRTLVKHLMKSNASNLRDLELIQVVSLGEAISIKDIQSNKYRLKTFFSGWVSEDAITEGKVDLIPSRLGKISQLIESGRIHFDVAFIQITPPNEAGYCSLGLAVDVARQVMEQAAVVVGEINTHIPFTFGETFVPLSDFDYLVRSEDEPIYIPRWHVDEVFDQVAANVASVIEDGSCIVYSIGPLYDALAKHLINKRNLGVHSPIFTDALMDIVKSGAVTNRYKEFSRGKSVASYAFGTKELMSWLDRNPLVEFLGVDAVFSPLNIGRNPRVVTISSARKVDLSGYIILHAAKGAVVATPADVLDFINGAELSQGGLAIFALPSRNRQGEANIRLTVKEFPNLLRVRESVDMVVTEYGVANLKGRTVRERAQSLIDIAHPDDRAKLVEEAKAKKVIYQDQIFLSESGHFYPANIAQRHVFKGGLEVNFRAIKPSDEEEMRRLFYRFSDKAVYYRYFSPIKVMPHAKMQSYVNVDPNRVMSIVGLTGPHGEEHIIAEARFVRDQQRPYADIAFVVDEQYQGAGIASKLYKILITLAKERGLQGFTAEVLSSNKAMMKVLEKGGIPLKVNLRQDVYELVISFDFSSTRSERVMYGR